MNSKYNSKKIINWLLSDLEKRLDISSNLLDVKVSFSRLGLNSMHATKMVALLNKEFDLNLNVIDVWSYPNVELLASYVCGEGPSKKSEVNTRKNSNQAMNGPVAVVGLACRFPDSNSPQEFWELLTESKHAVSEVPSDRWNVEQFYNPDVNVPGKMQTRYAGFIGNIDEFDAEFFGISPREAAHMDPQQRIMLKLCWEAMEDMGVHPASLKGSRTGVFMGVLWSDYADLLGNRTEEINLHTATGHANNLVANRVSYTFGFQGPSIAIDTACSSSLVAIHMACQSLRTGESDMVLAGGINLIINPATMVALSKFGGLAPDSKIKAFDADADGFVRGEGGGVVALKPLQKAIDDGDYIYCTIEGSACNNDGPSNGLTAPSPEAQEDVLRLAYEAAGINPWEVSYVEAHGTGTKLGDPIEAKALGSVLGGDKRADTFPLLVGSVKTNIGHLEGAAGIAGVLKTVLSLKHNRIPASLHYHQPNPHIPFKSLGIEVNSQMQAWPKRDKPNVAGTSSFGWGGTNCHVVFQEYSNKQAFFLPLSNNTESELLDSAKKILQLLTNNHFQSKDIHQLCQSNSTSDSNGQYRLAISAPDASQLEKCLTAYISGEQSLGLFTHHKPFKAKRPVFVFSPQGGQWVGMGKQLLQSQPAFRNQLVACDYEFKKLSGWSLIDTLNGHGEVEHWQRVHGIQPLIWAVQLGIAAVYDGWGIKPQAVVGHSLGEIAAAYVAGAHTLGESARLVYYYSLFQAKTDHAGSMAIIGLSPEEAAPILKPFVNHVAVAGHNGPSTTVISGDSEAIEAIVNQVRRDEKFAHLVDVNVAAHSKHMDPILREIQGSLETLKPRATAIPMFSTLTGKEIDGRELGSEYWPNNLRSTVLFSEVIESLLESDADTFLEINPHPIMVPGIQRIIDEKGYQAVALSATRRDEDERGALLDTLGQLYCMGQNCHFNSVYPVSREYSEHSKISKEAQGNDKIIETHAPSKTYVLPISAHSQEALTKQANNIMALLEKRTDVPLKDICYTSATGRSHLNFRAVVVGNARDIMTEALNSFTQNEVTPKVITASTGSLKKRKIAFVFPGQGSQWIGMGRELYENNASFCQSINRIDRLMKPYLGVSVVQAYKNNIEETLLNQIDTIQPLIFAVQVALAETWQQWGITPDAVIGHSMGEVAAVYLAGGISLQDAIRIICERTKLMRKQSGKGAMLVVELSLESAEKIVCGLEEKISIAVCNSPRSTVLSGDASTLDEVKLILEKQDVYCRFINVDVASHSPQMDLLRTDLLNVLAPVKSTQPDIPIYSTVMAQKIESAIFNSEYWVNNLREPVMFADSMSQLLKDGFDTFIEISPHPILVPAIEQCISHQKAQAIALGSLRRDENDTAMMLLGLGQLYVQGHPINWQGVFKHAGNTIALPSYPWANDRHWYEPFKTSDNGHALTCNQNNHPLLGTLFSGALNPEVSYHQSDLSQDTAFYLSDHVVQGANILPASTYIEMVLACQETLDQHTISFNNLEFKSALLLPKTGTRSMQMAITNGLPSEFNVFSREDGEPWTLNTSGTFGVSDVSEFIFPSGPRMDPKIAIMQGPVFYKQLAQQGLGFGPHFQGVSQLQIKEGEALAEINLPTSVLPGHERYCFHPVLLDSCLQVLVACFGLVENSSATQVSFLTTSIESLTVLAKPSTSLFSHARLKPHQNMNGDEFLADVDIYNNHHVLVCQIRKIKLQRMEQHKRVESEGEGLIYLINNEETGKEKHTVLLNFIREQVAHILGAKLNKVDPKKPLNTMGLTSLMTLELRNLLERGTELSLPATLIFNYPTIEKLTSHLAHKMGISIDTLPQSKNLNSDLNGVNQKTLASGVLQNAPINLGADGNTDMQNELDDELNALEELLGCEE